MSRRFTATKGLYRQGELLWTVILPPPDCRDSRPLNSRSLSSVLSVSDYQFLAPICFWIAQAHSRLLTEFQFLRTTSLVQGISYLLGAGDKLISMCARPSIAPEISTYLRSDRLASLGSNTANSSPYLKGVISRTFRNFDLSVSMGQLRSIQIFVVGQARRPGTYTVSSLSTLVNASVLFRRPSQHGLHAQDSATSE